MGLLVRCCSVLFVVLILLVTSRPLFAEEPAPLLRIGCLDVSDFPDDAPERLLVSYTRHYLDEISRSTGWQYQYMPMDERTAREMLRQGSIDMYFPAQRMGTDESEFSLSTEGAAYSILSVYAMEDSALACWTPSCTPTRSRLSGASRAFVPTPWCTRRPTSFTGRFFWGRSTPS